MELDEALASLRLVDSGDAAAADTAADDDSDDDVVPMPLGVLACVLVTALAGDIASLCAVACVCRAWRLEAGQPWLWRRLQALPAAQAARLTLKDLAPLAARSGNTLESIDVEGALFYGKSAREFLRVLCGRDVAVLAEEDDVVEMRVAIGSGEFFYSYLMTLD